jgi:hypothetical protein
MIMMFVLPKTIKVFGMSINPVFIPFIYLIGIYFLVPNSSLLGHLCGIIAGLLLKFAGFHLFLPRFSWVSSFDDIWSEGLKAKLSYKEAKPRIEEDFGAFFWRMLLHKSGMDQGACRKYICCCLF